MGFEEILLRSLDTTTNISVKVIAARAATLLSVRQKVKSELTNSNGVYVMLRVNNITNLFYKKQIICAFDNLLTRLKTKLLPLTTKVGICHILGLDILTYNLEKMRNDDLLVADYPEMQAVINGSIMHINRAINSMNISSNVVGSWLSDIILFLYYSPTSCKYMVFLLW